MTNKMKGLLAGASIGFFTPVIINAIKEPDHNPTNAIPGGIFLALIGVVIGYLVGASVKEKNS